ncbi:hypothetical protein MYOV003v1_p0176 [Vibrio phage 207E48.1]|nr:hypothetical protein MYOV003v1_p0176 [Vibrio phage 207E48.1]
MEEGQQKLVVVMMTEEMCEKVMDSLGQMPYREVAGVYNNLQSQFKNQASIVNSVVELAPKPETDSKPE